MDWYEEYKANRSDPPEDLKPQFDIIKKVPNAFNLESIESNPFSRLLFLDVRQTPSVVFLDLFPKKEPVV